MKNEYDKTVSVKKTDTVFLCGDEEKGHHACIDGHLTTACNPGMRLMPLPVICCFYISFSYGIVLKIKLFCRM